MLTEQERQILHDLSNVLADIDRAYEQVKTNENRYLAAEEALEGLEANRREGLTINLEQLLDIQRRLTEAQSRYYQSRVEYAIALKNLHVEKGSILDYASMGMIDATTTTTPVEPAPAATAPLEPSPTLPTPAAEPADDDAADAS